MRPKENSVSAIHDTKGLKRLNFSHLNEHKFRCGFKDTVDPMRKCGLETDIEILGWCPAKSVLPHRKKVPL